jgi:hypothetical protein
LKYIDVAISDLNHNGQRTRIRALDDSGSELCVVKASLIQNMNLTHVGSARLRGIVGAPIEVTLVKLHISLVDDCVCFPIVCAACPGINEDRHVVNFICCW